MLPHLSPNRIQRNCIVTAMTGSTLTSSPSPAEQDGEEIVDEGPGKIEVDEAHRCAREVNEDQDASERRLREYYIGGTLTHVGAAGHVDTDGRGLWRRYCRHRRRWW
ncbi:hypothetical protein JMJ35_000790 [Cladonia borealis]|uniref:Uncharacterized protein n=1 Tax=Cladonia borealis TaxID=184061 RepID=A0AA39R766_9LECA|nr:hypothetical protein JMJ35_000790 [Cladonia borealis]